MVLVAVMLMIGLLPYIEALVQRGVPRAVAVLLVLSAVLAVISALLALALPSMVRQVGDIKQNLPETARQLDRLLEGLGVQLDLESSTREINWDRLASGRVAIDYGQRAISILVTLVTTIVITAYLLVDTPKLARFVYQFFPAERELEYDRIFQSICRVVGGYLRGQLLTSVAVAVYTFIVLVVLGIPNPLAFAVLAGLADVIPLVGALIAIVPVTVAALQQSSSQALLVLVLLMAYQQFEDKFLVPRVYGETLNLPPVIVLIAALAGTELMGLTGALLALPVAAVARVWLDYYLSRRGISLAPIEETDKPEDPTDQPFAPDSLGSEEQSNAEMSLIALAGKEPRTAGDVAVLPRIEMASAEAVIAEKSLHRRRRYHRQPG